MKYYLIVLILLITSCNEAMVQREKKLISPSFGDLMNNGSMTYQVGINEFILINHNNESKKWQVSLGKRDAKLAIIDKYENNSQKSLRFTKIGTYQVTLGSHRSRAQGAIMLQTLTIIVK